MGGKRITQEDFLIMLGANPDMTGQEFADKTGRNFSTVRKMHSAVRQVLGKPDYTRINADMLSYYPLETLVKYAYNAYKKQGVRKVRAFLKGKRVSPFAQYSRMVADGDAVDESEIEDIEVKDAGVMEIVEVFVIRRDDDARFIGLASKEDEAFRLTSHYADVHGDEHVLTISKSEALFHGGSYRLFSDDGAIAEETMNALEADVAEAIKAEALSKLTDTEKRVLGLAG